MASRESRRARRRGAVRERETRPERRGHRRVVVGSLVLLVAVAGLWLAPRVGARIAQQLASREMSVGAMGPALRWLAWAAWLRPDDYHPDLMKADCYRQLSQTSDWIESVQKAKGKGAPEERIEVERRLGRLVGGEVVQGAEMEMEGMVQRGAASQGVLAAFVRGYLAAQSARTARVILEAWTAQAPDDPYAEYLWSIYDRAIGDTSAAEARLEKVLAREPRQELARAELAALLEDRLRPDLALRQYVELAIRSGGSEAALLGLARTARHLGRLDEARSVLAPLISRADASPEALAEMAQIELDSDAYAEAERWFDRARLNETADQKTLSAAAVALTLGGKPLEAERLVERAARLGERNVRTYDVLVRLKTDPADAAAPEEWKHLTRPLDPMPANERSLTVEKTAGKNTAATASDLYTVHCGVCHGASGDGRGRAARHLFPRPRDLRSGRSRLVSTVNGVPSLADLESVLARGMPGTSMPSFEKLTQEEHTLLAREVVRLRREGVRDEIVSSLRQEGEEVDEAELREAVDRCTVPGEPVRVPPHWPAPAQAVARGKVAFETLGCAKCHGKDGTGSSEERLYDEQGEPDPARDLVHEPFKGDRDPRSIYIRIAAGMPGSAHPAAANFSEEPLMDLVEYVRSLAREPERALTNYARAAPDDREGR